MVEYGENSANNGGGGHSIAKISAVLSPGVYCAIGSQNTSDNFALKISFGNEAKSIIIGQKIDCYNVSNVIIFSISEKMNVDIIADSYKGYNWCYSSCSLVKL